jgi:tRNA(Met) C34 N-acetyltransferase TmcA
LHSTPISLAVVVQNQFPDILAVVQVALEGAISADSAQAALAAGQLPQGDMLPWMIGQQFQDNKFPSLSGARIVRIATHPSIMGAGYGSKAVKELCKYYQGERTGALSPALNVCAKRLSCLQLQCYMEASWLCDLNEGSVCKHNASNKWLMASWPHYLHETENTDKNVM